MELEFIARNTELTPQQRALAQKKFDRLAKYFNAVQEARLTVTQEKHRISVEAFIRGKDFEVAASSETPEWTTSLQEVVGKLEQQARRMKQRLTGAEAAAGEGGELAGRGGRARVGAPRNAPRWSRPGTCRWCR